VNVAQLLRRQADERPEAPALIEGRGRNRRVCTFAGLDDRAARAAQGMTKEGLEAGDTVLLLQPMSIELYVAVTALLRRGLVAMVPDASAGREHIAACCDRRAPDAMIGPAKAHLLRLLVPALRRVPTAVSTSRWPVPGATRWASLKDRAPQPALADATDETPALLTFTSGSTGTPKAAVRTHGHLRAQYAALRDALSLAPGEIDLATLPIFVLANLARGLTTVVPDADLRRPAAVDPGPVLAQIRHEHPTRTGGSPAFYERLLDADDDALTTFEWVATGGAPLFPDTLRRFQEAAPETTILAVYGSTEAEPIAHVATDDIRQDDWTAMRQGEGLLAGPPVDDVELRILPDRWGTPIGPFSSEDFAEHCCAPGTAGEIVVAGPHVLPGYLDGVGDEETKFAVDGTRWHRTGDAGRMDEEGRLWLLGRCHARIDDERGTVYPFPVESAARTVPGVRRAAYVAHRGDRVLAIEADPEASAPSADQLRMPLSEPIDEVVLVEAMPVDRRHNAKIDYPALTERLNRVRP
jgi:acyl-CoA synthetase (AMP-forming)/AMP-acid ligase II